MRRTKQIHRRPGVGYRERGRRAAVPCGVCARPMEDGRLYELRGASAGTIVILRGVPCLLCPSDGHPRKPSSNDFCAKLAEAVLFRGAVPSARARRFGRLSCHGCGRRLKGDGIGRDRVESELRVDGAAMTIEITTPLIRCDRCGAVQVRADPRVSRQIGEAIDAALARGGLAS